MTPTPKKQRKQLTIVEKLQIIEMKEVKGYGFAKIAREKKLHEASVRTIYGLQAIRPLLSQMSPSGDICVWLVNFFNGYFTSNRNLYFKCFNQNKIAIFTSKMKDFYKF